MRRVAIIGTTGSGKSTLGERLAVRLGCPFIDLDALNWGPNWTAVALAGDCWVAAGNYSKVRDIV
jgi:adenylate kinase family enzyme